MSTGYRLAVEGQSICRWSSGAGGPAERVLRGGVKAGTLRQCRTGGAADGAGNTHAHHRCHTHERQQQSVTHAHHRPAQTGNWTAM